MKIKLTKQDQQTVIKKLDSIEDLRLHATVQNMQAGGYSQFSQWTVFYQFSRVVDTHEQQHIPN